MTSTLTVPFFRIPAVGVFLAATVACCQAADPLDWPNWRGPNYDNTSQETNLPESWDPAGGEGSNLLWKNAELAGRSTPIVMSGRLYTLVRDQPGTATEGEKVVCADAATGEVLWEHRFNVYLSDVPDTRVGWSSVVGDPETGRVYANGVSGYFCCLEGDTGKPVWERSLHEELGLLSTYGGRTNFPLIYKDTVITSAVVIGWGDTPQWSLLAKPAHRFMAFDKATGELRWLSGTTLIPEDTTYSTPALARINDQDVLVFGSGDGKVWSFKAATGEHVWSYPLSRRGLNVSPVVGPNGWVYSGQSEENVVGATMGAVVAIDGTKQGDLELGDEEWILPQEMVGKSSPLLIDGRLYTITDTAKMNIFDAKTGKQVGKRTLGRAMRGTPVYADGKIYTCTNEGMFYILKPSRRGVDVLQRERLGGEEVNASPIVSHGRVYLTTSEQLYCIADKSAEAPHQQHDSHTLAEPAPVVDRQVTHIQLSPWDVLMKPGDTQEYTVRFFNAKGDEIVDPQGGPELEFSVAGPGSTRSMSEAHGCVYAAPTDAQHECALITCKYGELTASARVRVVPPLPWEFTFDSRRDVPLTWVGGRIRYNLREDESGNQYLAKPVELPTRPGAPTTKLGTRSRMWMGSPELSNYTVQADIQMKTGVAGESSGPAPEFPVETSSSAIKLPSAGLINSCYTFTLFGPNGEARLYSWCTHDRRSQATVPMEFSPDKWYTMKLKVQPDEPAGVAYVSAKVWPRDEDEPSEWTMEITDKAPNYSGSPGMFGDSKDAEFYVDNLSVTPN
ncbi:outer membrane biogenesis protein BamB [Posidoniimonas polymericola]|uniref:Outer membrane biogenesis protein BamB n=1 Tax=Posidoniimonas polymericola TaxID=2528002 RepID=A0A5C5YV14_9BACT|nr:PQQ-binding-like beta-propeller repeat protein [Posidoniimonas polymericola]TWT78586.1 outer membrane biogenesis protein BamB [Posidoniimonas polymericola]